VGHFRIPLEETNFNLHDFLDEAMSLSSDFLCEQVKVCQIFNKLGVTLLHVDFV
jgi:hypothetical protein